MTHIMDLGYEPHKRDTWPKRYGELKRDVKFISWPGQKRDSKGEPIMVDEVVPAGTTVKIVMVSRFGDVGVTLDLSADVDYAARINIDDIANLREQP